VNKEDRELLMLLDDVSLRQRALRTPLVMDEDRA
jgi:hypothetical protein